MGEAGGQGIGKPRPDAQHRVRPFNGLFHRAGARRTAVRTVKTRVTLVKNALTHQHGGVRHRHVFDPLLQGMFQAMAQDKEISQQRGTLAHGQLVLGGIAERLQAGTIGMRCL